MPHEFSFSGEDTDFASADESDGTSDADDVAGGVLVVEAPMFWDLLCLGCT